MKTLVTGESDWTLPNTGVTAYPNLVDNPSANPDKDGQKYILAGTPLTAAQDPTQTGNNNQTVVLKPTTDPSNCYGILRTDTNVINGPQKAAVVNGGIGNIANMDPSIQSIYNNGFQQQLKKTLPRLQLINRDTGMTQK